MISIVGPLDVLGLICRISKARSPTYPPNWRIRSPLWLAAARLSCSSSSSVIQTLCSRSSAIASTRTIASSNKISLQGVSPRPIGVISEGKRGFASDLISRHPLLIKLALLKPSATDRNCVLNTEDGYIRWTQRFRVSWHQSRSSRRQRSG